MFILYILLFLLLPRKNLISAFHISKHQDESLETLDNQKFSGAHTIIKRNVPMKDELEFYKTVNQIKPETLELLMPNITGEPYVRTPPSNHCCYNGGTCFVPTNNRADRYCKCPSNFKGRYCAEDVDECLLPDACEDHEVCRNTYGSYNCSCEQGYVREGLECKRKVSCYEEPCLNFSDCVDLDEGRIICLCRAGFKGTRCEIKVPECEDSSCTEEESCIATADGFICEKL